jgi:hypothetical protein
MPNPLRISITETATLLDMSVKSVREAVYQERQCNGVDFPRPIILSPGIWQFMLKDVMAYKTSIASSQTSSDEGIG